MKICITILGLLLAFQTSAALIKSAQKGNWNNGSTWVGGNVPQSGDSIWIDYQDTVTVTSNVSLGSNTVLLVDTSSGLIINPGRRIEMGSGSRFYLRGTTSQVAAGVGGGSAALIRINGTDVWSAGVQGTISGPICLPSGTVSWCGVVTLPVKYNHWEVTPCNMSVCLNWSTTSEENNSHFTVLRSTDISHFDAIGIIQGAGNSSVVQHYSFRDESIIPGITYYYQLQQTDYNGEQHFTSILSSGVKEEKSISALPNPASKDLNFHFNGFNPSETVKIILSNSKGNIILEWSGYANDFAYEISGHQHSMGIIYAQYITTAKVYYEKIIIK